ncbi:MAG: hypothetical protein WCB11_16240 [Terriglobales bacterium]
MLTRDQIQEHIDQLDAQIPKQDAELVISYGGDPASSADCEIVGNYIGYLRFGVEMLKAAIVEPEPEEVSINISVGYMEIARWGLRVRRITRREDVTTYFDKDFAARFPPRTWKNNVTMCCEALLGIFVVLCLLIGFGEMTVWFWHRLF